MSDMGIYLPDCPDEHIPALICAENIAELCRKAKFGGDTFARAYSRACRSTYEYV